MRPWCWLFVLLTGTSGALSAAELEVNEARLRLLPGDLPAAGYFTLVNTSEADITLTGANSPAFGNVMMHRTVTQDGVSSMQHLPQIELASGEPIEFAPGGYHLMLMKRTRTIAIGDDIGVTLLFANGEEQSVMFRAVSPTTQ
jgi:copper(I)-binding protein